MDGYIDDNMILLWPDSPSNNYCFRRNVMTAFNWILWHVQEDTEIIDRMIAAGEATHNKWRHPDPYIGNISALLRKSYN